MRCSPSEPRTTQRDIMKRLRHGHWRGGVASRTYEAWRSMKKRCAVPKNASFEHYRRCGIIVCDRWRNSFENFLADMGEAPVGLSLDRYPDNDGNYEPGNCRWATAKQQAENRRNNHKLTHAGKEQTIAAWAEEIGLPDSAIHTRLQRGWSISDALTLRSRERNRWSQW